MLLIETVNASDQSGKRYSTMFKGENFTSLLVGKTEFFFGYYQYGYFHTLELKTRRQAAKCLLTMRRENRISGEGFCK